MMTTEDISHNVYSKDDFVFFWGHTDRDGTVGKSCLSQWYIAPMIVDGIYYNCVEQYLMAEKARTFGDHAVEELIMAEYSQMAVKKLGRRVSGYVDSVWADIRQKVSAKGNLAKFTQNEALGAYLLSTGNKILVEASPKDSLWGIGVDEHSHIAPEPRLWPGRNLLGFALMEVRDIMRGATSKDQMPN